MDDLTSSGLDASLPCASKGLAFEIADLLLIRSWAVYHHCQMSIRLDHGADGEEYEEVIAFHTRKSPLCRFLMWRNAEGVFVQPLVGRRQRYEAVSTALESLRPKPRVKLTDITATTWPADQLGLA
jgi:hypothetical protein